MPIQIKEYPFDFHSRKFNVEIVLRADNSLPQTFEEYSEAFNVKLSFVEMLAFFVGKINEDVIVDTNPVNLKSQINQAMFLIKCFVDSMHLDGDLESFLKGFE